MSSKPIFCDTMNSFCTVTVIAEQANNHFFHTQLDNNETGLSNYNSHVHSYKNIYAGLIGMTCQVYI